jgi:hypothetical protein
MSAADFDANRYLLMCRIRVFVFDDPRRRCYNGAFGAHHFEWGAWETLDRLPTAEKAEAKLKFWRELNDYAVSQRGKSARREFKVQVLEVEDHTVRHLPSDDTEGGAL